MSRAYFVIALLCGAAYAMLTPPWQAPDEVGHYYRACAIAAGESAGVVMLPRDARDLVAVTWMDLAGRVDARYDLERLKYAAAFPPNIAEYVEVRPLTAYTAVPYAAHAATLAAARLLRVRPLVAFYAGRLANVVAALLLVALAIRLTPVLPSAFAAVGMTPMFLFLAGSYSADAVTTALAFCMTAVVLRTARQERVERKDVAAIAVFALLVALAKPAYFLVPLLAFAVRDFRARLAAALATAAGMAISISTAAGGAPLRHDGLANPREQLTGVLEHPLRFAAVLLRDYFNDGRDYLEQLVGRLGWLDVLLPNALVYGYLLVLLYVALSADAPLARRERVLFAAVFVATLPIISGSLYLTWSVVGGTDIDGVQGRYFLPIAPLALLAIGARVARPLRWLVPAAGTIANLVAIAVLVRRYW